MNLIEFNDKLIVNNQRQKRTVPEVTQNDIDEFVQLMHSSRSLLNMYQTTEEFGDFIKVYPSIKKVYSIDLAEELFYASKLHYQYNGVPTKLVYIITKMFSTFGHNHVNDALSRSIKYLAPYLDDTYLVDGKEVTLKDVIEFFAKSQIKLLTSSVPKVKSLDCYEVYVPDADRVALLPNDIASKLPYADCEKIVFDKQKGLVIEDIIVRTMNGRLGITKDDFDLRQTM